MLGLGTSTYFEQQINDGGAGTDDRNESGYWSNQFWRDKALARRFDVIAGQRRNEEGKWKGDGWR